MTIDQQLALLRRGAAEVIPEDELVAKLKKSAETGKPLRVKLGVDPTAKDVTLGWAVVLRKLRQFQDLGHEACLIIGDFTAQIGDPTGKSKTRKHLTREEVEAFARACQQQLFRILDESKTRVFFNSDWLAKMTLTDVIQLGSKYTVARLLEREDFAKRLAEQKPLHVSEILYPLCQGQDSVAIEADIEMGGMDQKFNNLVGRELQRECGQEPQVVFLMPLLVGTDGVEKMSQSLGNYIGINDEPHYWRLDEKTGVRSLDGMYARVMKIPDNAMRMYFELCTDVPMNEVDQLLAGHLKHAKMRLAREIVTIYHGIDAAIAAELEFDRVFAQRLNPTDVPEVEIDESAPVKDDEMWIVDLLRWAGLVQSGSEGRRLIQQGSVEIDNEVIRSVDAPIFIMDGRLVRVGKRRFAQIADLRGLTSYDRGMFEKYFKESKEIIDAIRTNRRKLDVIPHLTRGVIDQELWQGKMLTTADGLVDLRWLDGVRRRAKRDSFPEEGSGFLAEVDRLASNITRLVDAIHDLLRRLEGHARDESVDRTCLAELDRVMSTV